LWPAAYLAEIWRSAASSARRSANGTPSASLGHGHYLQQCGMSSCRRHSRSPAPRPSASLVQLVKGTALTSIIGFVELVEGRRTPSPTPPSSRSRSTAIVALIYFALCFPLSQVPASILERKLNVAHRNH
jgi:polar amino acid transport system permease protein